MKKLSEENVTGANSGWVWLKVLFIGLINILPLVLYFSYFPIIALGTNETMNFELSLPLIWLVIFDLVAVVMMTQRKMLFEGWRRKWLWILLPMWLSVSVLWSLNSLRGVLTVGILWLIYLAVDGMWSLRELLNLEFRAKWWKWFFGASLVACAWCVIQCILDLIGVSQEYSLMCDGCVSQMFGFPHPNGWAIEPQFMGNLLLAPAIIAAWILMTRRTNKNSKRECSRGVVFTTAKSDSAPYSSTGSSSVAVVKTTTGSHSICFGFLLVCLSIFVSTLFLTFSRGAIYAFIVAVVAMSAMAIWWKKKQARSIFKRVAVVWGVVILSFIVALNLQGLMTAIGPTDDTYIDGVAKVLNHLSLGVIDIRGEKKDVSEETQAPELAETGEEGELLPVENSVENSEGESEKKAVFEGYVAESTDTRLRLTSAALETWSQNTQTALFGVGLGGAGQALYDDGLSPAPKEIIQNQYASLLLETGIIGISLFIMTIILVVRVIWKSEVRVVMLSLILAYGVTLCFFSGLPNALQIYLLPVILYIVLRKKVVS